MTEEQLRVLLVDDEASLREPLARFLRDKHSCAVDAAADGERAWALVTQSESPYQVALIDDLLAPSAGEEARLFGIELMKRIKSRLPQTEVIIFTGWGWGLARAREALQAGAFRYLAKTVDREELALTIRQAAEFQRLKGDAREKQILEQLMKTSAALLSSHNQEEALNHILQGIQAIGFDRARLYLLADNGKSVVGKAQAGMDERFIELKWPVADDWHTQTIISERSPRVFKREEGKPLHSEEGLDKGGVDEWAEVPLMLRGEVIGKLSADNRNSRRPLVSQELTPIALFALQAAATIELNEQKDQLERLFASSPNGIIAVDALGNVTSFNKQAEDVLGYRADEVLGKPVENLYFDLKEPRKIGKMLHLSDDGRVANYETFLKSKDGQKIPIRQSSTWLYDPNGKRIGSVGYFEDLRPAKERERRIELLLKANNIVAQAENMDDGLKSLAEMIVTLLDTAFCRIFLLNESNRFLVAKAVSLNPSYGEELDWNPGLGERTAVAEWQGLSDTLANSGPVVLRIGGRRSHPVLEEWSRRFGLKREIQSLLVIPLRTKNGVVGLLDVGELRCWEKAPFSEEKIDLAAAIAGQIVALTDRIRLHEITERRMEELEQLSRAAQAMSKVSNLKQTLRTIVEEAIKMFEADFSTIWSYDSGRGLFLPDELEAVGYSERELERFKELEPQPGRTTYTALQEGWIGVDDVSSLAYPFLTEPSRELLKQSGIESFQCVALKVGDEPVGVLYTSYKQPRAFGEEDRRSLESFAAHAALSLRNAQLLDQVSKAKTAARVVAQVTTLGDHTATLDSIVKGTLEVVRCDAVVLYVYNQATNKLDYPPTMKGVRYPDKVTHFEEVLPDSFVYKMLELDEPCIVDEVAKDDLFKNRRFAQAEGIESCVAISLKPAGQKVGVMFVNYRTPHRFTSEELTDIELFADQAAIAVRNTQLFEDAKKLREQEALVKLSEKLLGTVKQQEMLDRAVAVAADVLDTDLASTILPDKNGNLILKATAGCWRGVVVGKTRFEGGKGSHTGYTILEKEPVIVDNYAEEARFTVAPIVFENGVQSSMSVPMFSGNEVVGAMVVYTKELRRFTEAEKTLLSLIANQTAIALKSAEQYEALERKRAYLNALYEAGKAITGSFALEPRQVLSCIVRQAVECVIGSRAPTIGFGVVHLYNEAKDELICESVYSLQGLPDLSNKIGQRRFLGEGRIGISGRTVKTREPQLVRDVGDDPDYVEFDPRVKSQLTAPLLDQARVIGVLSLESEQAEAFDEDTQNTLQALAELAVITIRNSKQYEELRETKGLVGSRTALAWTGMISSAWRHTIEMDAITIREEVQLLRSEFARSPEPERIAERMAKIERLANRILEKPITPPLSVEEAHSVSINDLIRDRTNQLWNNDPYKSVKLDLKLGLANSATAHASLEWLRRCLDVLIDNAVDATVGRPDRRIIIASREVKGEAEISVTDNGKGISEEVAAQLFREPVKKLNRAKGLGIGLLFAQTIVQTYGGDLRCDSTGPTGTTMTISLPLET